MVGNDDDDSAPTHEMIDDEAEESDDGDLSSLTASQDAGSQVGDQVGDGDEDIDSFVVDDDAPIDYDDGHVPSSMDHEQDQYTVVEQSDSPPTMESFKRRLVKRGKGRAVVDKSDDEEDMEAITADDSMYSRGYSVKASTLPDPMITRSRRRSLSLGEPAEKSAGSAKRPRLSTVDEAPFNPGDKSVASPPVSHSQALDVTLNSNVSASGGVSPSLEVNNPVGVHDRVQPPHVPVPSVAESPSSSPPHLPSVPVPFMQPSFTPSSVHGPGASSAVQASQNNNALVDSMADFFRQQPALMAAFMHKTAGAPQHQLSAHLANNSSNISSSSTTLPPFSGQLFPSDDSAGQSPDPAAVFPSIPVRHGGSARGFFPNRGTSSSSGAPVTFPAPSAPVTPIHKADIPASQSTSLSPMKLTSQPSRSAIIQQPLSHQALATASASPPIGSGGDMKAQRLERIRAAFSKKVAASAGSSNSTATPDQDAASGSSVVDPASPMPETKPKVYLEDLENHKPRFTASAVCGVTDPALQDELLVGTYDELANLPADRVVLPQFIPTNTTSPNLSEDETGGRIRYSFWPDIMDNLDPDTSYSAVTFEYCEPAYVNVARANPNRLSRHAGNATGTSYRLAVDGVFATCVDAGMCIDSALQEPAFQSATSTRPRKWLALMHHNQCFERWQTVKCLVAGEQQLYTAMIPCEDTPAFAVMYQSMLGPDTKTTRAGPSISRSAPSAMFSPVKSTKNVTTNARFSSSNQYRLGAKYMLAHDEPVPIYDARRVKFDFASDLPHMASLLPPFDGEIPPASFVVVGSTSGFYKSPVTKGGEKVANLSCNLLWVIVCGTPKHK